MTWTAPAYPRVDEPFNGTERATLDINADLSEFLQS